MISFVFSVIQLFFQIKVLIILPRALGLRHAQVIGRQGRRITGVTRKHAVHRAERHAARPLLPQLLGKQDERQAAACQRVRDELRAVAEQIDGAGPLGKLRHERVDGDRAVVRQAGKLPSLQREYRVVDLLLPRVHAGAVDAVGVSRAARHRLERGHAVERQLQPPGKALGAGHADAHARKAAGTGRDGDRTDILRRQIAAGEHVLRHLHERPAVRLAGVLGIFRKQQTVGQQRRTGGLGRGFKGKDLQSEALL